MAALLDETPFPRISVTYPADPAVRFPVSLVKPGIVVGLGVIDVASPEPEVVEDLLDPILDERGDVDVAVATRACPVDHGAGAHGQMLIEATSMVPWQMCSRLP